MAYTIIIVKRTAHMLKGNEGKKKKKENWDKKVQWSLRIDLGKKKQKFQGFAKKAPLN